MIRDNILIIVSIFSRKYAFSLYSRFRERSLQGVCVKCIFRLYSSSKQLYIRLSGSSVPPMQAPNASAHTSGCIGKLSSRFCPRFIAILTIMVVSGTLSTKALASADTHSSSRIATANRDSSLTDRMKFSVCLPIQSMRPRRERACRQFFSLSIVKVFF